MTFSQSPLALLRDCPVYAPTPLVPLPGLAASLGIAALLAKDESRRPLGSFKSLGGVYAALRALSRATGQPVAELIRGDHPRRPKPDLVCASDGNHGLAVAAAARLACAHARVFLPDSVPEARAARIGAIGASVIRVAGTYDDAVLRAAAAARDESAILVADTGADLDDPVLHDVLSAYGVIAHEVREQLSEAPHRPPTHLFVQAGVGGLAAAMAEGLRAIMAPPALIVAVEPAGAACVRAGIAAGRPVRVPGSLETSADMLSCGEASGPALASLLHHGAEAIAVSETDLLAAPADLSAHGGPVTTPSGAAGLAGLRAAQADAGLADRLALGAQSRVLLFVTEAAP